MQKQYYLPIFAIIAYIVMVFSIDPLVDLNFLLIKPATLYGSVYRYLEHSMIVSLLYPAISSTVNIIFGRHEDMYIIHCLVFISACFYLWCVLFKKFGWLAFPFWLLILYNPFTLSFIYRVMTDSLFYSAVIIIIGQLITLYDKQDKKWYGLAIVIGLAVVLRIAALSLTPMLIVLYFFGKKNIFRLQQMFFAIIIVIGLFSTEKFLHSLYHGEQSSSLKNLTVIGKAKMVTAIDTQPPLPTTHHDYHNSRNLFNELQIFSPIISNHVAYCFTNIGSQLEVNFQQRQPRIHPESVAWHIIAYNIKDYAIISLCHYVRGWMISSKRTYLFHDIYNENVQALYNITRNTHFYDDVSKRWHIEKNKSLIMTLLLIGYSFCGVITLLLVFARLLLWRLNFSPYLNIAAMLSMMIHGYMLFIAMANLSTTRYSLAMASSMIIIGLFVLAEILRLHWHKDNKYSNPS